MGLWNKFFGSNRDEEWEQQAELENWNDIVYTRKEVDNYTYVPSSKNVIPAPKGESKLDTYTYIPSQENTIKQDNETNPNKRTYIPSQMAANIQKTWDNSHLAGALERADRAEARAHRILAGDFTTR